MTRRLSFLANKLFILTLFYLKKKKILLSLQIYSIIIYISFKTEINFPHFVSNVYYTLNITNNVRLNFPHTVKNAHAIKNNSFLCASHETRSHINQPNMQIAP